MAVVKLKNVRLSFPDIWEAVQFQGTGPFAYKASFLQPEGQAVYLQTPEGWKKTTMQEMVNQIATEQWKDKAASVLKTISSDPQKCCWYDGDLKSYDGYEGNFVLASSRSQDKGRPLIMDADKTPLTEKDGKPYAGCYVNATVEIWAQDNKFGKGLRATLRGIQFVKDGDAFAAGTPVSDDEFEEIDAPATEDDLM